MAKLIRICDMSTDFLSRTIPKYIQYTTIYHVTNYERLAADHHAAHDSISHESSS